MNVRASRQVRRAARDAVVEFRFKGGPQPVNPFRSKTMAHMRWDMAVRQAERAVADLMVIGS